MKYNKYGNKKVEIDGVKFDSKREAERWIVLSTLAKHGDIRDLRRQVTFVLFDGLFTDQRRRKGALLRRVSYVADFVYVKDGKTIVEDVKGFRTAAYVIKRAWMYEKYGIVIQEV